MTTQKTVTAEDVRDLWLRALETGDTLMEHRKHIGALKDVAAQVPALQSRVEELERERDEAKHEAGALRTAYADALTKGTSAEREAGRLRREFRSVESERDALRAQVERLRAGGLAVTTDAAQDALEDPVGHADRRAQGFVRVYVASLDALNAALPTPPAEAQDVRKLVANCEAEAVNEVVGMALEEVWPALYITTPRQGAAVSVLRAAYPSLPVPPPLDVVPSAHVEEVLAEAVTKATREGAEDMRGRAEDVLLERKRASLMLANLCDQGGDTQGRSNNWMDAEMFGAAAKAIRALPLPEGQE